MDLREFGEVGALLQAAVDGLAFFHRTVPLGLRRGIDLQQDHLQCTCSGEVNLSLCS